MYIRVGDYWKCPQCKVFMSDRNMECRCRSKSKALTSNPHFIRQARESDQRMTWAVLRGIIAEHNKFGSVSDPLVDLGSEFPSDVRHVPMSLYRKIANL